jgi:hypothetical protein
MRVKNISCFWLLLWAVAFSMPASAQESVILKTGQGEVQVDPSTLAVRFIGKNKKTYSVSDPVAHEAVAHLRYDSEQAFWEWPEKGWTVQIDTKAGYLDLTISAADTSVSTWPRLAHALAYTLPLHQGKYIPANDRTWISYLSGTSPYSGSQSFSMQFMATNFGDLALLYVFKNMFNNQIVFSNRQGSLGLDFLHEFPATVKDKQYGFRIYFLPDDPVSIAKTYKQYVVEQGRFLTLEEKASTNPNIRKLYGAPHIYIWNTAFLVKKDIADWPALKNRLLKQLQSRKTYFQPFGSSSRSLG